MCTVLGILTHFQVEKKVKVLVTRVQFFATPWTGSGKIPWSRNGNPLQYFCLENSLERGAWQATVHGVAKELNLTEHTHTTTMQQ